MQLTVPKSPGPIGPSVRDDDAVVLVVRVPLALAGSGVGVGVGVGDAPVKNGGGEDEPPLQPVTSAASAIAKSARRIMGRPPSVHVCTRTR